MGLTNQVVAKLIVEEEEERQSLGTVGPSPSIEWQQRCVTTTMSNIPASTRRSGSIKVTFKKTPLHLSQSRSFLCESKLQNTSHQQQPAELGPETACNLAELNAKFTKERPSFATLPPELRCMIYLFATPPRYVYLRGHADSFKPFFGESIALPAVAPGSRFARPNNYSTPDGRVYFTSSTEIPPLLHTCQESRNFLIKQGYELTFRTPKYKQRTWFNYKKDILVVPVFPTELSRPRGTSSRITEGRQG
ncbi:unnamed protein product [Fusarium equiseti]|uniref:2EXR domain-containing protein n=1 Tax=Fusarium equiseti TaxID=61235 RepID=A0A8J2IT68_FUSEQ|nr:unnamed protein product [Fusarium equiseti]